MNILASYNWLKRYVKTDVDVEAFSKELSLKSMSVEHVDHLKDRFNGLVIGFVDDVEAHPDADRLRVANVNVGSEVLQIVCGGINLEKGQRVLVALPGSFVRWHGEGDLVEIKKTKVRGVESTGMICAPSEVGFDKAPCPERGIWDVSTLTEAPAGTPFAEALGLDDIVFDVEITTNRPDAMSILGLAREAAAATGGQFVYEEPAVIQAGSDVELTVQVENADLCPRYMAVVMKDVNIGPSPAWLQMELLKAGHRPINNIVDITNYILHEYGQPMHAFDADKLQGSTVTVRPAREGESIVALDDVTYKLDPSHLVIADKERPVAIAGVMGGKETGAWEGTKTIVFEAATFDAVSVRKTSRSLNVQSDSQLLFEKGLSMQGPELALRRAVELAEEIAGAHVASPVYDVKRSSYEPLVFDFDPDRARALIGANIANEQMETYLTTLGFKLDQQGDVYRVTVPYWRDHDIEDSRDFTEEVARMYGYANLPIELPASAPPTAPEDQGVVWESRLKSALAEFGYTEFFGYSFVSAQTLEAYDIDPSKAVALHNPLSSDLTHMRTSLVPSMLRDIEQNQRYTQQGKVFELARVYRPVKGELPTETSELVVAHFGVSDGEQSFRELKGMLETLADRFGFTFALDRLTDDPKWHPTRTASVTVSQKTIGVIGQVADVYQEAFGLDRPAMLLSLDIEALLPHLRFSPTFEESPEYQASVRDISFVVARDASYTDLVEAMLGASDHLRAVELVEVYRGSEIEEGKKSITVSLTLRSDEKTLDAADIDREVNALRLVLEKTFGAILR